MEMTISTATGLEAGQTQRARVVAKAARHVLTCGICQGVLVLS